MQNFGNLEFWEWFFYHARCSRISIQTNADFLKLNTGPYYQKFSIKKSGAWRMSCLHHNIFAIQNNSSRFLTLSKTLSYFLHLDKLYISVWISHYRCSADFATMLIEYICWWVFAFSKDLLRSNIFACDYHE